ncbi:MAG: [protein-PII] uridylyltransferase [Verrucomicrobia bacterium]|nr:[protein-PII] uridylyltransferase [Verrucomicrobiota bacterium]
MSSLLEKIQADARQRLTLPPGRPPAQELARYKNFLKVETARLKMLHRAGTGGSEICRARAAVLDALLTHIMDAVRSSTPAAELVNAPQVALIAIGGYGRGELNPHSDIDIMLLHAGDTVSAARGKLHPFLRRLLDPGGLLYTLIDLGLKVGHSVRTLDDCVRVANSDMQSKTSLIEARLITGDQKLFEQMQRVVLAKCVLGHEKEYIAARLADQSARRAKHGNSACMQEPNIKNGCGGLRDFQNLLWMTFFKYRVRSLDELRQRDLVSESDVKQLDEAYDFLLRARNELHYHANRPVDALTKSVQPAVAHGLGYTDRSPSRRLERFMRDFYRHARNIDIITRMTEQRLALVPEPKRLQSLRQIFKVGRSAPPPLTVDGFRIVDGQIHADSPRVFRDQPRRLMRVFLHAQQRGARLHPDLAQLVRRQLPLVDSEFLRDAHVHETFLEILNQRGAVAPVLRAMHEVDFLGKYIPEFGRLTCLVQHEFFHQYAADEHTLMCIEQLDRVWNAQKPPHCAYAETFQKIEKPSVLYLALLLHDAGKAQPGDHHEDASSRLALRVARRLGLDGAVTHTLRLVIEEHLAMVKICQRRDLDDPGVIRSFAALVQNTENLNLLTLHTFADSMGTNEKLWNGFKETLLWTLHHRAAEVLAGGTEFIRAEAKQRELLRDEVRRLMPRTFGEDELDAHFHELSPRYFLIHTAREVLTDLTLSHRFIGNLFREEDRVLEPVVQWHNEPDRGHTTVKICTWDRAGLFSKLTGSFAVSGLNILSARVFTRGDGFILDTFYVVDARTGLLVNREEREKFETTLHKALTGHVDFAALLAKRKLPPSLYQSHEGERLPTFIRFDNAASDASTVIDLETEDRVGLLYVVSQALSDLGLDISVAKISTEKGAAMDGFYVTERGGGKLLAPERQNSIEAKLRLAIAHLDAAQR